MIKKKHERMYCVFGKSDGNKCRDCCHFMMVQASGTRVSKCEIYGNTRSAASDWNGRKDACGMYNREYKGRKIIELSDSSVNDFLDEEYRRRVENHLAYGAQNRKGRILQ